MLLLLKIPKFPKDTLEDERNFHQNKQQPTRNNYQKETGIELKEPKEGRENNVTRGRNRNPECYMLKKSINKSGDAWAMLSLICSNTVWNEQLNYQEESYYTNSFIKLGETGQSYALHQVYKKSQKSIDMQEN